MIGESYSRSLSFLTSFRIAINEHEIKYLIERWIGHKVVCELKGFVFGEFNIEKKQLNSFIPVSFTEQQNQ